MPNALPAKVNAPVAIRLLRVPPSPPLPSFASRRATLARPTPAPTPKPGLVAWIRVHKAASVSLATVLVVAVSAAAILAILQNVTTTPSAKAPLAVFQNGADYVAINAAGFATVTLGSSGASATLALSGVSGAASVTLGNVLKLNNQDATHPETVTLMRSAAPNAAITSFLVTVKNGATQLVSWDAATTASSSSFTLPVSTAVDINITLIITDGTAAGALGSFAMEFSMTPT
jgi:hypothetical protein